MLRLTFQTEIQAEPIHLTRAALCYAREIAYPALEIDLYLAQLDELVENARQATSTGDSVLLRARAVADYLFQNLGFAGNVQEYHDPRNSYLNDVLDRHLGIPITLAVIYMDIAKRLDLPVQGIGLPGHFIVSIEGPNGPLFLDPFHGGQQLSVIDCARLVELSTGFTGPFQPQWLYPVQPEEILARMLYNLRSIYIQQNNWSMALPVVEHLLILQPQNPAHLRDLGTIHNQNGSPRLAIEYFQRYLAAAPQAEDAQLVRWDLKQTAGKMARRN
jgi:regulator of sirC expression with transglutaminase-like and TPR domain